MAKAGKEYLRSFVDDLYSDEDSYSTSSAFPHLAEQLDEMRASIESLDENTKYAIAASEL